MAGRQFDVSVLVRLKDALSSPLGAIQRRLAGLSNFASRIGVLGGLIASISFAVPIASAAAFDQKLRDIAVTAGLAGARAETFIGATAQSYQKLALQTGQLSSDIADAGGQLVAAGMDFDRVNRLLGTTALTATAASASIADIASTVFSLSDNLGIADADIKNALAGLVVGSKAGNVELRDMARYFSTLAPAVRNLSIAGTEASATLTAALEVVRKGAPDAATAANNLKNLISKIISPEVGANFKKFGIDIQAVMKDAAIKGINPFEAVLAKLARLTGMSQKEIAATYAKARKAGMSDAQALEQIRQKVEKIGGAARLARVFGDQQAMEALLPLLANLDAYEKIKTEVLAATGDIIDTDAATQLAGPTAKLRMFSEVGEQVLRRIGKAFSSHLDTISIGLMTMLSWIDKIDARWPGLIDTALSWAGAGLLVTAGLAALGPAAAIASAALGVLGSALTVVLSPIGAVAAALGAVAYIIYSDWAGFAPLFERTWTGIKDGAQGWVQYMRGLFTGDWSGMQAGMAAMRDGVGRAISGIGDIIRRISADMIALLDGVTGGLASKVSGVIFGAMTAIGAALSTIAGRIGASLSTVTGSVSDWAGGVPAKIAAAIGDGAETTLAAARDLATKAVTALIDGWADLGPKIAAKIADTASAMARMDASAWSDLGKRFGDAVVDAVKSAIDRLVQWFGELPSRIVAAIGSIDLSNLIQWPSLPSWLGGGSTAAAAPATASPAAAAAPAQRVDVGGDITVRATGGSEVTSARSRGPVSLSSSPNRGLVQGRP